MYFQSEILLPEPSETHAEEIRVSQDGVQKQLSSQRRKGGGEDPRHRCKNIEKVHQVEPPYRT